MAEATAINGVDSQTARLALRSSDTFRQTSLTYRLAVPALSRTFIGKNNYLSR